MSQVFQDRQEVRGRNRYPRIDGIQRVTGGARYCADWKVPDMLYGRVVTATISHGTVRKIDTSKAIRIPGVRSVITCMDDKTIWQSGEINHKRRVLADKVRFRGECIAAIAATSRMLASKAVEAVEVEYDEAPSVFSIEEAQKEGAPKIWESGNLTSPMKYGFGDFDATFARGDLIFEADYTTSRLSPTQLEPAVSLAWWVGDKLTVVAASQAVHVCREGLAQDLNIPVDNVRVITLFKGGSFGGKGNVTNYDIIAALLARKAAKPVMVEYSRLEEFVGTSGRWSSTQHLRASVLKSRAMLLAMDLRGFCDVGAYLRFRPVPLLAGPDVYYNCEAWKAEVCGVYTNTPATGFMRAPAGPQACFAAESFIDEIADALHVNPLEFRLQNHVVRPHHREVLTSNGLRECLLLGSEAFEWKKRWHPPPKGIHDLRERKLSGVGVAMTAWHASLGRGEASVKIGRDGILEVRVGVVDVGTGAKSTMAVIAAGVLGVPLGNVRLVWGDTEVTPFSRGEIGSTTTTFTGTAVREAATRLKEKLIYLASTNLSAKVADLRAGGGHVTTIDGRRVGIGDLIADSGLDFIEEKTTTEPQLPEHTERLSFAAHFAEVEVDAETGQIQVTKYVAVQDSGEIVNRLTAENQVQGSVVMGLGMTLSENLLIDKTFGFVQNPSLLTYRVPGHTTIPKIQVIFAEVNDPYGPKTVGETSILPVPATIGNAIFNATGRRLRKLPFAPDDMLKAIEVSMPTMH